MLLSCDLVIFSCCRNVILIISLPAVVKILKFRAQSLLLSLSLCLTTNICDKNENKYFDNNYDFEPVWQHWVPNRDSWIRRSDRRTWRCPAPQRSIACTSWNNILCTSEKYCVYILKQYFLYIGKVFHVHSVKQCFVFIREVFREQTEIQLVKTDLFWKKRNLN